MRGNNWRPGRGNMDQSFRQLDGGGTLELHGRVDRWIVNYRIIDVRYLDLAFECYFDGCLMVWNTKMASHTPKFQNCKLIGCGFEGSQWPAWVIAKGSMTEIEKNLLEFDAHRAKWGVGPMKRPTYDQAAKSHELILPHTAKRGAPSRQGLFLPPGFQQERKVVSSDLTAQPAASEGKIPDSAEFNGRNIQRGSVEIQNSTRFGKPI